MRRQGVDAERRAARHYRARGYRVLGRNVWAGGNEIDLIVRRGRSLVFVEVKARSRSTHGDATEFVDAEKLRRLRRAAESWLARHPDALRLDLRFEVVALRRGRLERVRV